MQVVVVKQISVVRQRTWRWDATRHANPATVRLYGCTDDLSLSRYLSRNQKLSFVELNCHDKGYSRDAKSWLAIVQHLTKHRVGSEPRLHNDKATSIEMAPPWIASCTAQSS
jgi:hypothetical protein